MIENLGYIPKENEQASVLAGEWQLRVEQVKDNRIAGTCFQVHGACIRKVISNY